MMLGIFSKSASLTGSWPREVSTASLVRAKVTHYHGALRVEGAEWNHEGKLYEHIEPVKQKDKPVNADDKSEK